ncbi:MAG: hypothetical protein KME54_03640 [Tolypothrix brevis GSE-NOS-MK-07-07A]|nr:hypothetical protein [Tolypothrix brevis GSE-NOS-MK-07-07A]
MIKNLTKGKLPFIFRNHGIFDLSVIRQIQKIILIQLLIGNSLKFLKRLSTTKEEHHFS